MNKLNLVDSISDWLHICKQPFSKLLRILVTRHKPIPLKTPPKIYEAQVNSILIYNNSSSRAASIHHLNKLDVCPRNHLRKIIGMTHCKIIKLVTMYKRFEVAPLSEHVTGSRWKIPGHVLCSDNNSPAQLALHLAVLESQSCMKSCVGNLIYQ